MKNHFCLTVLSLLLVFGKTLVAQDIHFSQFQNHILGANPAQTGFTEGDFRLNTNHRLQWLAIGPPFLSNSVSFDHRLYWHKERFGWGFVFLNDRSGTTPLNVNHIRPSFAYHKQFSKHVLSFGIQPGWSFKSFALRDASFPEQYDRNTGGFNTQLPNNEAIGALNINYFDLNAGLSYQYTGLKSKLQLSYSTFHMNRPIESFFGNIRLSERHSTQVIFNYQTGSLSSLRFLSFNNFQNKASESLLGVYSHLKSGKKSKDEIFFGVLFRDGVSRNNDAFIASVGVKLGDILVAYSYDVTLSELRNANNLRGATEIAIIYEHPSSILNRKAIPCERY